MPPITILSTSSKSVASGSPDEPGETHLTGMAGADVRTKTGRSPFCAIRACSFVINSLAFTGPVSCAARRRASYGSLERLIDETLCQAALSRSEVAHGLLNVRVTHPVLDRPDVHAAS